MRKNEYPVLNIGDVKGVDKGAIGTIVDNAQYVGSDVDLELIGTFTGGHNVIISSTEQRADLTKTGLAQVMQLRDELKFELGKVPAGRGADIDAVSTRADAILAELSLERPDEGLIRELSKSLQRACLRIADVDPKVPAIGDQLVKYALTVSI